MTTHQNTVKPGEAPPAYAQAVYERDGHLAAPSTAGGHQLATPSAEHDYDGGLSSDEDGHSTIVPSEDRHSFENATRELPDGWVRQFDPTTEHVYFVDTRSKPPRSTWVHPYDDPEYLMTLPSDDPKRVAYEQSQKGQQHRHHGATTATSAGNASSSTSTSPQKDEKRSLGRKMKDKVTGTTHDQRVKERERRKELERRQYQEYIRRRAELIEAQRNGTYQPMYGPPVGMYGRPAYASPYGYGYAAGPAYYRRPGMGAGGAMAGGLLGGLLLGGALF